MMKASFESIENKCVFHFTRFSRLYMFCSSGAEKKTGESIAMQLHNILVRI